MTIPHVCVDARVALEQRRGWGRYAEELLAALALRSDVRVTALLPHSDAARQAAARLPDTVAVVLAPPSEHVGDSDASMGPAELLPERLAGPFDLVHSLTRFVPPTAVRPLLATVHDISPLADPPSHPELRTSTERALASLRRPDHAVITVSHVAAQELVQRGGLAEDRITVVPLAASPQLELDTGAAGAGDSSPFVLHVGGAGAYKELERLLDAVIGLGRARLLLVGDRRWGYDSLLAGRPEDWVQHIGRVDDDRLLARLYADAAAVVTQSRRESFCLPLLEAMACGAAVVAADLPVLREVGGDAPLYYDAASTTALAGALGRVLDDEQLAAHLRRQGRARAALFSWERTAAATVTVYRRLLGR